MELGRKGIFFSITALLIVGLLFTFFTQNTQNESSENVRLRVQEITRDTEFLINNNLESMLRVEIKNALRDLAQSAVEQPTIFTDEATFNNQLQKCISNGECYRTGGTHWTNRSVHNISLLLQEIGTIYEEDLEYINATITFNNISLSHTSPWHILAVANFSVYLRDAADISEYNNTNVAVTTTLRVDGLLDPLGTRANGSERYVHRSLVTDWNISTLHEHANKGTYVRDESAPSYLERFIQNPAASTEYGIHSVLPPGKLGASNYSYLDYHADKGIPGGSCRVGTQKTPYPPLNNPVWLPDRYAINYSVFTQKYLDGEEPDGYAFVNDIALC